MTSQAVGRRKTIAAFFDLDGTLLPAPSLEWRFFAYLLARAQISMPNIGRWLASCAINLLRDPHVATEGNKVYLAGLSESMVSDWMNSLSPDSLPLFVRGLHRIRWHFARGHHVFFVSGTLEPLARTVALTVERAMSCPFPAHIGVCATRLDAMDDRWTGFLAGEHQSGEAKARSIRMLAAQLDLDLARSFAYGNAIADLPMLTSVGFPTAVNPSSRLERAAKVRGWQTWNWKKTGRATSSCDAASQRAIAFFERSAMNSMPAHRFNDGFRSRASREESLPWPTHAQSPAWPAALGLLDTVLRANGAFEWVTFVYLTWLVGIFAVCHRGIVHAPRYLVIHLAVALVILCLATAAAHSQNKIVRFARQWYPLPLYIFFFEELEGLVHAIYPGWFDRWLIQFDLDLAGIHPSLWLARFSSPGLNDFMQFAYMTYFLYLVILPAILFVHRERIAFWTVMVSTAIAHYSVYVIAVLLPVESPYYSLASLQTKPLAGGYCTSLINLIEHFGRVHGAAFPSAHVAGSTVAILASWRYRRWLFWVCLPFFVSMCVATVYGRYHYVADVLAGLAVGTIGFLVGDSLMHFRGALPKQEN
jgi:phosphoserine phosphatase/membrane-associated phospholipid phosphatase